MPGTLPERDWKYLRGIEKELLSKLCRRINRRAVEIIQAESGSEHEKYLALYRHIKESDLVVADCFNDWRRSNLDLKLRYLQRQNLLGEEQLGNLSEASLELLGSRAQATQSAGERAAGAVELIVLSVKEKAARCRILGSDDIVTLRASGTGELVPGEIVVVKPAKNWSYGGHPYLSGEIDSVRLDIPALGLVPLKLRPLGLWSPEEHYWGEADEPIEKWAEPIIARGARQEYEMEQVLPGANPDDFDSDPISESNSLKETGDRNAAYKVLMDLCQADLRCLDAHAHLGNFYFDTAPEIALRNYGAGFRIGELSMAPEFAGLLPWGYLDNRPFLRCMHGYGLCLWRLGRFPEAAEIFRRMLWLNPSDNQGVRFLIDEVSDGIAWSED
jgi:tetratricopeptide (TPR) repeat protein